MPLRRLVTCFSFLLQDKIPIYLHDMNIEFNNSILTATSSSLAVMKFIKYII